MGQNTNIAISIVTYQNEPAALERLFQSISHTRVHAQVHIIDNASDARIKQLSHKYHFIYIAPRRNVGYGAGHNIALRESMHTSRYHAVLNPDVTFEPIVLEQLCNFMDKNPTVGIAMPKIIDEANIVQPLCKLIPHPVNLLVRRFSFLARILPGIVRSINERYELLHSGYDTQMEVPCLSGCFMFIRTNVLKQVGLFDEHFFMYMEDFDFSRRVHRVAKTVYAPHVVVRHDHARGSYKSVNLFMRHAISAIQYFNKWGWLRDAERESINQEILYKLVNR